MITGRICETIEPSIVSSASKSDDLSNLNLSIVLCILEVQPLFLRRESRRYH